MDRSRRSEKLDCFPNCGEPGVVEGENSGASRRGGPRELFSRRRGAPPGVTWFGDWSSGSGGCSGATRGETRAGASRRRVDRSRRSEKLDGFPDCSWPGGSRGATRGETLGGPAVERSPEGGGGAKGGPDRIDLSRRSD